MSCTVCYLPLRPRAPIDTDGQNALRDALRKQYGSANRWRLDRDVATVSFLQGLIAAGVPGAADLLHGLEKYLHIEVHIEY